MAKTIFAAFAGLVLIMGTAPAAILIDDFSDAQLPVVGATIGDGPYGDLLTPAPGAIGNAREFLLVLTAENTGQDASVSVNGTMDYSQGTGVDSNLEVFWYGEDSTGDPAINPVEDLSAGGNTGIRFRFATDSQVPFILTLFTTASDYRTFAGNLPDTNSLPEIFDLLFSSGVDTNAFDITSVAGVSLFLNPGISGDLQIDYIEARDLTGVPEPMSLGLVGGALLIAGLFGRKRLVRR